MKIILRLNKQQTNQAIQLAIFPYKKKEYLESLTAPAYSSRTTPIKTVIYFPTEHENCPFCILNILLCGTEMMIIVMVPCQRMLTRLISLRCPLPPPSATTAAAVASVAAQTYVLRKFCLVHMCSVWPIV